MWILKSRFRANSIMISIFLHKLALVLDLEEGEPSVVDGPDQLNSLITILNIYGLECQLCASVIADDMILRKSW